LLVMFVMLLICVALSFHMADSVAKLDRAPAATDAGTTGQTPTGGSGIRREPEGPVLSPFVLWFAKNARWMVVAVIVWFVVESFLVLRRFREKEALLRAQAAALPRS